MYAHLLIIVLLTDLLITENPLWPQITQLSFPSLGKSQESVHFCVTNDMVRGKKQSLSWCLPSGRYWVRWLVIRLGTTLLVSKWSVSWEPQEAALWMKLRFQLTLWIHLWCLGKALGISGTTEVEDIRPQQGAISGCGEWPRFGCLHNPPSM